MGPWRAWATVVLSAAVACGFSQHDECTNPGPSRACPRPQLCVDPDLDALNTWQCVCPPRQSGYGNQAAAKCESMIEPAHVDECVFCVRSLKVEERVALTGNQLLRVRDVSAAECTEQCLWNTNCAGAVYHSVVRSDENGCLAGVSCCTIYNAFWGGTQPDDDAITYRPRSPRDSPSCNYRNPDDPADHGVCANAGQTCEDPTAGTSAIRDWICRCKTDPTVTAVTSPATCPTPSPPTPVPPTATPATSVPATNTPATDVPETDVPETDAPATAVPATNTPATDVPETDVPETDAPATAVPATGAPATDEPETESPPVTDAPATNTPATAVPATSAPATNTPATAVPETGEPETKSPPVTDAPVTAKPATGAPATDVPETDAPATAVPATGAPTTDEPETESPPVTDAPATNTPATAVPATSAPATNTPATAVPETGEPETKSPPVTDAPVTAKPATGAPATDVPATGTPATVVPATQAPRVQTTQGPSTLAPLSAGPRTASPLTRGPLATGIPATWVPPTAAPAGTGTPGQPVVTTVPGGAQPATGGPSAGTTDVPAATAVPVVSTAMPAATPPPQRTSLPSGQRTEAPGSMWTGVPAPSPEPAVPGGEVPDEDPSSSLSSDGSDTSSATEAPPQRFSGAAEESAAVADTVRDGASAAAALAAVSASSGPALRLVAAAAVCEPWKPIPVARYSLAMSPLQLRVAGSRALGAMLGNTALAVAAMALGWVLRAVMGWCVTRYFPSVNAADAQAMVMFPAVPLAVFLMLYQGTSLAGLDLLINPDSTSLLAAGLFGACVCVALPVACYYCVTAGVPREAYVRKTIHETGWVAAFLFDGGEWVSRTRAAHFARRWGPVLRPFRCETAWYAVVEFAASFLISAAQAVNPTTLRGCGHVKICAAVVFAVLLVMEARMQPHLHRRNSMFDVMLLGGQTLSMVAMAAAYYSEQMDSMWFTAGAYLMAYALLVLVVRTLLDIAAVIMGALKGRRRRAQEEAFAEEDEKMEGVRAEVAMLWKGGDAGENETCAEDDPSAETEATLSPVLGRTPPPPRLIVPVPTRYTPAFAAEDALGSPVGDSERRVSVCGSQGVLGRRVSTGSPDAWGAAAGGRGTLRRHSDMFLPPVRSGSRCDVDGVQQPSPRGRWRRGLAPLGRSAVDLPDGEVALPIGSSSFNLLEAPPRPQPQQASSPRSMPTTPSNRSLSSPRFGSLLRAPSGPPRSRSPLRSPNVSLTNVTRPSTPRAGIPKPRSMLVN